jgi:copper oxidase (laccase) domain-containing protein
MTLPARLDLARQALGAIPPFALGCQVTSVLQPAGDGQWRFDLWGASRLVLRDAGVQDVNIHVTGTPTGGRFFSHRARQPCGRFAAIARLDRPGREGTS